MRRWAVVLFLGFLVSLLSLNVQASTVGTNVEFKFAGTSGGAAVAVGSGAEYQYQVDTGYVTFDIDPVNSTFTITMDEPASMWREWSVNNIQAVFSGGNLAQITGITRTGGTASDAANYSATVSGKTITVTLPAGSVGRGTIVFTFTSTTSGAAPTLTLASPNSGSTAGGTSVTLTGTNLTGATAVTFGGTAATSYTVTDATSITATTPAHAAGAVNVVVTTPGGTATLTNGYTYRLPLSVTTSSTHVACNSGSNGTATATATGGVAPYTYSWLPSGGTAATATGLAAGSYNVIVTDASNATVTKSAVITQPSALTATTSFTHPSTPRRR